LEVALLSVCLVLDGAADRGAAVDADDAGVGQCGVGELVDDDPVALGFELADGGLGVASGRGGQRGGGQSEECGGEGGCGGGGDAELVHDGCSSLCGSEPWSGSRGFDYLVVVDLGDLMA
jgi:hypothetical protein